MLKDNLTLVAVGSNSLVAAELHHILRSMLKLPLPIKEALSTEITSINKENFYICANTQGPALTKIVPASCLFVFELQPTTKFFLDIAQIPDGENVLVFNNRTEYAQLLISKCHELGINKLNFETAAYEELQEAELLEKLQKARYIIGVDVFTSSAILQSKKYKSYLRPDVKIISGQRTASVTSANRLLLAISEYYYHHFATAAAKLAKEQKLTPQLSELSQNLHELIKGLQQSVLQTVTLQVTGHNQTNKNKTQALIESSADFATIQNQLEQLAFLKEKIYHLIH